MPQIYPQIYKIKIDSIKEDKVYFRPIAYKFNNEFKYFCTEHPRWMRYKSNFEFPIKVGDELQVYDIPRPEIFTYYGYGYDFDSSICYFYPLEVSEEEIKADQDERIRLAREEEEKAIKKSDENL